MFRNRDGQAALKASVLMSLMIFGVGCSVESVDAPADGSGGGGPALGSGVRRIQVDGSSTVAKVAAAVQEEFESRFTDTKVALKVTGSGTGFKEMIAGRIDVANASRAVKDSELADCAANGVELLELRIALDGLTVCVNAENDWVDSVTVGQLNKIWAAGSEVTTWKDVDPNWPDEKLSLFGPGEESGTFDFFTEEINGEEDSITDNYSASADDNVTITGIAGENGGMGFFGYAYFYANQDKVRALKISATEDPADGVAPTSETVKSGEYAPLSRPLFIYVKKESLKKPEVQDYVRFFLTDGQKMVGDVGYVSLDAAELKIAQESLEAAIAEVTAE